MGRFGIRYNTEQKTIFCEIQVNLIHALTQGPLYHSLSLADFQVTPMAESI